MDINMPHMNGIEATANIKTRHPEIVVIGLSVNASFDNQEAMQTAGASMLLTKEAAVEQLNGAIQQAVNGIALPE
jgi:DNA-binding NarL/FixJ family response regulator